METHFVGWLVAVITVVSPVAAQDETNGLAVQPDAQNVVANSLIGTWRLDEELSKRLGHRGGDKTIKFSSNPDVVKKVPAKLAAKLREFHIFAAGTMLRGTKKNAFLVTELKGNPTIVWFRERDGDPMGDAESWNVSVVRAKERGGDLMFVGGDFNNHGFGAYARETKVVGKLQPTAAVTEMLRLLEAGEVRKWCETYVSPDDMTKMLNAGRTMEDLVDRLRGDRLKHLVEVLTGVSKRKPKLSEDGNEATWKVDGKPGTVRLRHIDGRWYLSNR